MNLDLQLVQGTLIVVSNVPNNSACAVGGDSWIYQFNYKTGTYVQSSALDQAGQKFTGQITVGLVVVRLPSGVFKGIATGATGTKTTFTGEHRRRRRKRAAHLLARTDPAVIA